MATEVFNKAQIELLDAMAGLQSEDDLIALKRAISEFFARRADEEMERLWNSGELSAQKLEEMRKMHLRTPYRQ